MNRFSDFSIKLKLILSVIILIFVTLSSYSAFITYAHYQNELSNLREQSKLQSTLISDYAITTILFTDVEGAEDVLSKLKTIPNINAAAIYGEDSKLFATYTKQGVKKKFSSTKPTLNNNTASIKNEIYISTAIGNKEHTYGSVVLYISLNEINEKLYKTLILMIVAMLVLLIVAMYITYKIQDYITTPITNLAKIAKEISHTENYNARAKKMYKDEVGDLYDDFNKMLEKIEQRGREREEAETISQTYQVHLERLTNELEERVKDRTDELQNSINTLKSTQSQLVESEKMSSLGNLVAGVAHEVNTPLGISITAASIFENEIKTLKGLINDNKLSKSALEHFIETVSDADDILVKNLNRAALLVRNFKKISVDQSSEEIRDFELNNYLKEVISTFKNELKHRPVTLHLDLDENTISMHSFPGAISQLIVNMLQNALLHAFDEEQEGEIHIKTILQEDKVAIYFSDNGKGVDNEVVDRIFEPFITTKRNSGGTGLGLNITYNLVTQHLNGTIKLDHEHKVGASFIIIIPCSIS